MEVIGLKSKDLLLIGDVLEIAGKALRQEVVRADRAERCNDALYNSEVLDIAKGLAKCRSMKACSDCRFFEEYDLQGCGLRDEVVTERISTLERLLLGDEEGVND